MKKRIQNKNKKWLVFMALFFLLGCSEDSHKKLIKSTAKLDIKVSSPLDILFIIDNSGSMNTHQTRLSRQIDLFLSGLSKFKHLDYRLAIISSDIRDNGKFSKGKFFDKSSQIRDIKQAFLFVGTQGNATEMFFKPISQAINNSFQKNFFREKAHLAIFFLTDTDDQSPINSDSLYNELLTFKRGNKDKLLAYGAFPLNKNCPADQFRAAPRLQKFISLVNAHRLSIKNNDLVFNLCDPQMGQKLFAVASHVGTTVGKLIYLSQTPDIASIIVKFGGKVIPTDHINGWYYDPIKVAIVFGSEFKFIQVQPTDKLEIFYLPAI